MTRNPFLNALAAIVYIAFVASFMFYGMQHSGKQNTVLIPIAVISLFTLSAAVMGYIFGFQPLQLYLDGKKKEAIDLFIKTVAIFGGITLLVFLILFSGLIK
jgi:hypothetical protein